MKLYNLAYDDMVDVVGILNRRHGINAGIMNKGQLDFALKKLDLAIGGVEIYPELHQKAAALMETVCKSHCLSDGNKRASMMAAEYLVSANGATLVLPLKSIRLTADCAMDTGDHMSSEISMWFKTHIAHEPLQLSIMLEELIEERQIVEALIRQGNIGKAERIVDKWLVFDNYPANKALWEELLKKWEEKGRMLKSDPEPYHRGLLPWLSMRPALGIDDSAHMGLNLPAARVADPLYTGHSIGELKKVEVHVQAQMPLHGASRLERAGQILQQFHYHEGACLIYDKLIKIRGETDDILTHTSFNLLFSGQYEKALAVLDRLLKSSPEHAYWNKLKAVACRFTGRHAAGLESANLVLMQNPEDVEMLKLKVDSIRNDDPVNARKLDKLIYRLDPDDPTSIKNMAVLLSDQGNNHDAVTLLDKSLQKNSKDASALYSKALCLSRMGNETGAMRYYQKSLEVDPNNVRTLINVGGIHTNTGEPHKAAVYLAKALKLSPYHPVGLLNMGVTMLAVDDAQKAVDVLEVLRSSEPCNRQCLYLLAVAYVRRGKTARALDALELLAEIDPSYTAQVKNNPAFSGLKGLARFQSL